MDLPQNTGGQTALGAALRFLRTSERFEAEVRARLEKFEPAEVDQVIEHLRKQAILDDRRTAMNFLKSRSGRRALGVHRLKMELERRGAPEALVDELCVDDQEVERGIALLHTKKPADTEREKAYRFLLSRGFSFETAHRAVRDFFSANV